MNLILNGEQYEHKGDGALKTLLTEMAIGASQVAVLVNDEVVARDQRDAFQLSDGDRVEVLTMAGGG